MFIITSVLVLLGLIGSAFWMFVIMENISDKMVNRHYRKTKNFNTVWVDINGFCYKAIDKIGLVFIR